MKQARQWAYNVIFKTLEDGEHSDELLKIAFDNVAEIDKSFVKRISFGTIERAVELDAIIRQFSSVRIVKMDSSVRTVLRMAVYELFYMDNVPSRATINEAVELIKSNGSVKYASFVNGVLRNIDRKRDEIKTPKKWEKLNLPKNLYEHLVLNYGEKTTKKIANYFLEKNGMISLHVNTKKTTKKDLLQHIKGENAYYFEDAIRIENAGDVSKLYGYEQGYFFVQDESSFLPVCVANIQENDTVVDICAAPGGKSMHAFLKLSNKGFLSTRDVSQNKTALIENNFSRVFGNVSDNVEIKVFDATKIDKQWEEKADVLLADVPCSGIGIVGRKPEIKYRAMNLEKDLRALQREILSASEKMLKCGGTLIYSTCTINPRENEENVRWLCEKKGYRLDSLDAFLPETLTNKMTKEGMLQILPGVHSSDGFFVARLIKEGHNES